MAVLGVDGCKDGWVGIRLDEAAALTACCAPTIAELFQRAGDVGVVAIDIPIGLPESAVRVADGLARNEVGPLRSSVFTTPPRPVLEAPSHAEATALCRQLCGYGISQQAFALRTKILEVDEWIMEVNGVTVVEAHPEVSFAALAGHPLRERKSTWAGFQLRRRLLAEAGFLLEDDLGLAGRRVAPDDVLDAAVVAWTANRVAHGENICLPDPPERVSDGHQAAIYA